MKTPEEWLDRYIDADDRYEMVDGVMSIYPYLTQENVKIYMKKYADYVAKIKVDEALDNVNKILIK